MMSFGQKNNGGHDGYHYAPDYDSNQQGATQLLVKIVGSGVLLVFGWVVLSLSGHNPIAKKKYEAAMDTAANEYESNPAVQEALETNPQEMNQYRRFSETLIGLRTCEQEYYARARNNRADKTHMQYRLAIRDYQNKNLKAYQAVTEKMMARASAGMLRGDRSKINALQQDIGMLHRPTNGDPAMLAAYDKLAARGKDQAYCVSTLSKVKSGQMDIKI